MLEGVTLRKLPWREILLLGTTVLAAASAALGISRPRPPAPMPLLEPVRAAGVVVDTLFVGGYARGSFGDAVRQLAADLPGDERELVGGHLDRIFTGVLDREGLGEAGRLRVVVERVRRPDGTTRGVRVLSAQAAVGGELHTAFYYERDGRPGYYDPAGRSLDARSWSGPLRTLRVTSPYGRERMHPILKRVLPHAGVDYGAAAGTPVHATADGVVVHAGPRGGYGTLIEIRHPNGYSTRYAHLSTVADGVTAGSVVRGGQRIGGVGMTGLATGPHLHYEVRRGGRSVDPARLVDAGGVAGDLSGTPGWALERQRLARLLARTPTVARSAGRYSDERG